MDMKRKFEMRAKREPNKKTFKTNPLALEKSLSETLPQGIKCLICAEKIALGPETEILQDQVSTERLLGQLLKVLKLSPEVCRLMKNKSSKVTVSYCKSCEEAISSCLKIAQEIDNLENEWERISDKIKANIIEDHHGGVLDSSGNVHFRKTLLQYFDRSVTGNQNNSADEDDEEGLISEMSLRPRPRPPCQEQIVNYLCDVNMEENMSDSGSEYAPGSSFEEERIKCNIRPEPFLHEKPQSSANKLKTRKTLKKPTALSKKPHKETSTLKSSKKQKPVPKRKPTPTVAGAASSTRTSQPNSKRQMVEPPLHGCKTCGLTFEDVTTLRNHQMSSHELEKNISCPECPEKFTNIKTARDHQIRVHGKSLLTTLDVDGNLDSFQCVYCEEEFCKSSFIVEDNSTEPPTKKLLEDFNSFHWNHRLLCKSRPRFALVADNLDVSYSVKNVCQFCDKEFRCAISVRNHEITVHTKDFKCYCEVCGLPFPSKGVLNAHHQRAHRENQFKCEQCPKTFKTNYQLKNHINTHNNIRSFVCEQCGKAFCTKNVLWMHTKQSHKKM